MASISRITIIGGSEETPYNFNDLYNLDKAGTLELFSGTPATDIILTNQIKPSDELALKIDFILSESDVGVGDTIVITGTDKDDNTQSETLTTEADGTYTTTKWFKTITNVDCNGFSSGTLTIRQNQWGLVWKNGNQFKIDAQIYLGDGTTPTYFIDDSKQIIFSADVSSHSVLANAHLTLGKVITASSKTTKLGCDIIFQNPSGYNVGIYGLEDSEVNLYGCSVTALHTRTSLKLKGSGNIWNNLWKQYIIGTHLGYYGNYDVYNLIASEGTYCLDTPRNATLNKIHITEYNDMLYILDPPSDLTIKNLYGRRNTQIRAAANAENSYSIFLVDTDLDNWIFMWEQLAENVFYRQYTFNLKVIDKDNNPISNATVILKDKDDNTADQKGFNTTTNGDGEIVEQTVSYGYYNRENENTLQSYSPHTLEISKAGYETYKKKFTFDKKIEWVISLKRISINIDNEVIV